MGTEFQLADTYTEYEQFINYQVFSYEDDTRRNLSDSSDSKLLMPPVYLVLFIMAQLGGLYHFLHLVVGTIMHKYVQISSYQELIKAIYTSTKKNSPKLPDLSESFNQEIGGSPEDQNKFNYQKVVNNDNSNQEQMYEGGSIEGDSQVDQELERKRKKPSAKLFGSKDI